MGREGNNGGKKKTEGKFQRRIKFRMGLKLEVKGDGDMSLEQRIINKVSRYRTEGSKTGDEEEEKEGELQIERENQSKRKLRASENENWVCRAGNVRRSNKPLASEAPRRRFSKQTVLYVGGLPAPSLQVV